MKQMHLCLKINLIFVLLFSILSSVTLPARMLAATDHLVINEVYYDAVKEPDEEWIEIYNPTDAVIDLTGYKIGDEETKGGGEGMYQFPAGASIETKSYLIVANKAASFFNLYGENPTFELSDLVKYSAWATGSMSLNNTGDEVLILDGLDQPVDIMAYGNGSYPGIVPALKVLEGQSFERQPKGEDTDDCSKDFVAQINPSPLIGLPSAISLKLVENGSDYVEVTWNENLDNDFKDYIVFQSQDSVGWSQIETINLKSETQKIIENLLSGTKYYFKTRVENLEGGFWDSNVVSVLTKKIYSKAIIVNELLPHPSTGTDNEFIELYNSSNEAIDLSGWILMDGMGSLTAYNILDKTMIDANSYLVFYKKDTHISLNDDGDFASLFWPDKTLVSSSSSYKSADYDISWSRNVDGNWSFSTTETHGRANIFTSKQEEEQNLPIIPIEEAKKQKKNEWVKVSGVVTVAPGLFGKRVMYIQDESGGIKIYFDKALWPVLKIGDKVIIRGKISLVSGEYEIKIYNPEDIVIVGHDPPPEPKKLIISQLNDFIGYLVRISGRVVKISGSTIWIDDGTGELRIYFYSATGIKGLGLDEGDWVVVIGILSKTSAGLRLLPRAKSDIKIYKKSAQIRNDESIINQVLDVGKAQAAGADYRIFNEPKAVESKRKINILGIIIIFFGLLSLASLQIFARIYKK